MKTIVIGSSLSGKTTLVRHLRDQKIDCSEVDEELTKINGGTFPSDVDEKHNVLIPKIIADILAKKDVLFFTNTDYFTLEDLRKAKSLGFKIVQIDISLPELIRRNKYRMENEGYDDMTQWLEGMTDYQDALKQSGLVDQSLDATLPTDQIASTLTP